MDPTARFSNPDSGSVTSVSGNVDDLISADPLEVRHQTRLDSQETVRLVESYLSGADVSGLLESFDIGRSTLYRILRSHSAPRARQETGLSQDDIIGMATRYQAGESLQQLAHLSRYSK